MLKDFGLRKVTKVDFGEAVRCKTKEQAEKLCKNIWMQMVSFVGKYEIQREYGVRFPKQKTIC